MINRIHERDILAMPMGENDAAAATIGQYIIILGAKVFEDQDDFSGKRPFGNSSWVFEVYEALIRCGVLAGEFDSDGYIQKCDPREADIIISQLFDYLKNIDFSKLP